MVAEIAPAFDHDKLMDLVHRVVGDFGAAASAPLVVIGDKLGLYRALAADALSPAELADRTATSERYVREWLVNQAASGFITYDAISGKYSLTAEQALAFAVEDSPAFMVGGFQVITAMVKSEPLIRAAFQNGAGVAWGEHDVELFEGTERFFRPGYIVNLVGSWLPALDGVVAKLEAGAVVADIGCGRGASTVIMARAFPNSRFFGFDSHEPSIERARDLVAIAGLSDRVVFETAGAGEFPGRAYDLLAYFDCLHDMGDPVGAARHALQALKADGSVLLVEPMAGATVAENLNPVGRLFAAASTLVCTPNALADGGHALGTLATDEQLRQVMTAAGFRRFDRVAETPVNRIFQVRP